MREPWWRTLSRILWWVLTRVFSPLMALAWPVLIIYGFTVPRVVDHTAMHMRHGEVAVLIGTAGGDLTAGLASLNPTCRNPAACSLGQRSYVVLPRALSDAAVTAVDDTPAGTVVTVEPGSAILVFLVWAACSYGTWRYVIRPMASNNRIERTREP